jgi:hypothetical protein
MPKTQGLSPKVLAQLVTAAVAWVLAHYNIKLDPDVAGAVALALGGIAGVIAKPGDVVIPPTQQEIDQADADARAGNVPAGPAPIPPPVMPAPPTPPA